jgi:endonuclease YncB( thermonuclease family)
MGTLRIDGFVKVAQFWPKGSADADTTQIEVDVLKNSFFFAEDDSRFVRTTCYNNAYVIGRGGRKDVIRFASSDRIFKISVRLQGVDAPELHYKAPPLKQSADVSDRKRAHYNSMNDEFCQRYAENAAYALGLFLQRKAGKDQSHIKVSFFSRNIAEPSDAVDTHGRFVGNIFAGKTDVNLWLAKEGWVVPTFYSSMTEDEINDTARAAAKGKAKKRVWARNVIYNCSKFEHKRIYKRPPCNYVDGSDAGSVLVPKLFRRTVNYYIEKKAKIFKGTFFEYMIDKGKSDSFYDLKEFFQHGVNSSTPYRITDFLNKTIFTKNIDQIVFGEGPSIVKSKATNRMIKQF